MEGVHGVWPNSARSADGRVWMPLQAALAVIDPQRFPAGQRQPDIFIQEVRVDERRQAFNSGIAPPGELVDLSSARAAVRMPPDHRHLEIVFGGRKSALSHAVGRVRRAMDRSGRKPAGGVFAAAGG
jgi:hypothetical protein